MDADEEARIQHIMQKILGAMDRCYLKDDTSRNDTLAGLMSVMVHVWTKAVCCDEHRKECADILASDIPRMLEQANLQASKYHKCLH